MSFFERICEMFGGCHKTADHALVTVRDEDSLWKIAERITGDGMNWTKIAELNPGLDKDHTIYPKQVLKIPNDWA